MPLTSNAGAQVKITDSSGNQAELIEALKHGAGHLDKVINTNNAGTFTIYDAVSAVAGKEIMIIDTSKVLGSIVFSVDFSTGLYVVSAGATCTVIYE